MSVLVFCSSPDGELKKSAHEVVTYGKKTAEIIGGEVVALVLGEVNDAGSLGKYGASKVVQVADNS
ncbi:MAG: electron transfer flavoprotein subunit alpha/FixB family protein, partial [Bacteroidota bacterium]